MLDIVLHFYWVLVLLNLTRGLYNFKMFDFVINGRLIVTIIVTIKSNCTIFVTVLKCNCTTSSFVVKWRL